MEIIKEINCICNKSSLSENNKQKLILLQSSLDNIYITKAKGAYIRSRAKWIEEGERSSAYFCRLEKKRQERNAVKALLIDEQECMDPDKISKEIFQFYSKLYSSSYSCIDADASSTLRNGSLKWMRVSKVYVMQTSVWMKWKKP